VVDEQGELKVAGKPYTRRGSKIVSVRVESVKHAAAADVRLWGAHEKVSVRRSARNET
jgi:hypothetical protein